MIKPILALSTATSLPGNSTREVQIEDPDKETFVDHGNVIDKTALDFKKPISYHLSYTAFFATEPKKKVDFKYLGSMLHVTCW